MAFNPPPPPPRSLRRLAGRAAAIALSSAALTFLLAGAAAPTAAQNLTMGLGSPVSSLDPHYHNLRSNNEVARILFDPLVTLDASMRPAPGLAESWRAVDAETWEFKLRPGVRFHNGAELTAEDVAFTFRRIPTVVNPGASFVTHIRAVRAVEVVDARTVRLRTRGPFPMLPIYLSFVAMLDEGTHQGMATEDFNAGRAAIGTGPFRLVQHRPGDRIELERNDAWWGPQRPHWQRVSYRMITNDAARSAALLAGDVDFIDQVPTSDMARLRRDPRLRLAETTSLRTMYLVLDFAREDGSPYAFDNEGRPLRRNPLRDLRVRRALSMAIDRAAIVDRVMEGAAVATGQFLPEGSFSYVPDLPVQRYDPEGARALLREAGYPEGFRLTIHGSNDRYINDSRVVQAIGQMWTRAGVRTAVEAQPYATFITRATRREHSVSLLSWGNSTGEVSVVLNAVLGTPDREKGRGTANRGPYSNPEMDARVEAALGELDDARRERMLQEATRMAIDDLAVIPLYLQKAIWAMRRDLDYAPRADEMNSPGDVRPAAAAGR